MVCNTLARLDFILVPLPAARTAAKIGGASWRWSMTFKTPSAGSGRPRAGAAGFEPAIPGPKPGALPLGHAPTRTSLFFTAGTPAAVHRDYTGPFADYHFWAVPVAGPLFPRSSMTTPRETGSQTLTKGACKLLSATRASAMEPNTP